MRALTVNGEVYELREAVEREEYGKEKLCKQRKRSTFCVLVMTGIFDWCVSSFLGVGIGCTGKCDSNPCLNNGTCLERYNKYLCDCRYTAFKGPICADGKLE